MEDGGNADLRVGSADHDSKSQENRRADNDIIPCGLVVEATVAILPCNDELERKQMGVTLFQLGFSTWL